MAHKEEHPLLQKPLYVFDLPKEILGTLAPKDQGAAPPPALEDDSAATPAAPRADEGDDKQEDAPAAATSCGLCNLTFASLAEQRSHVRSDLHGYNLKQKMRSAKPVTEAEFEKLVGELDESISGSESSESDEDDGGEEGGGGGEGSRKDTTLSALLKKQAKIADSDAAEEVVGARKKRRGGGGRPPLLWFTSSDLPGEVSLGIYRAILSEAEQDDEKSLVEMIRKKQLSPVQQGAKKKEQEDEGGVRLPSPPDLGPHYFLCMIGGGHFAAMIVALSPKIGKKHTGVDERQATVVAHKTFHRYTTRRKQGGSQSASDASRGAAHSAGSSLRRYNEAALTSEVRALLSEWKDMIDTSELLFIRATGNTNRRTLFGPYDGQILRQNDPRIRGFPFSTRRATQAELMRSFIELTRVKVSRVDAAALAAAAEQAAAQAAATPTRAPTLSKPAKPAKPSPEEEEAALHTSQLQALIRRSKAPALVSYIQSNGISPDFRFHPIDTDKNYHAPTPLHLAAHLNAPAVVLALLTKAKADPAAKNLDDKTPFELAGDRATRDAFRIARYELGDSSGINWTEAEVPAGISRKEVEQQQGKEKEEEKAREAERRKKETERLRKEDELREQEQRERRVGKGRSLGASGLEKTAAEKREEEARGLTPEMRMRLERERRARAAEERIRRMQQG